LDSFEKWQPGGMAFGCGGANSTRFLIFFQPPVRCTVIRLKLKAQKAHKEHHSLQNLCCIIHWGFGASDLESRRLSTCAKSWARTSRRLWMSTWRHRPSTSFAKSPSLLRSTVRSIPPLTDHTLYFRGREGPCRARCWMPPHRRNKNPHLQSAATVVSGHFPPAKGVSVDFVCA